MPQAEKKPAHQKKPRHAGKDSPEKAALPDSQKQEVKPEDGADPPKKKAADSEKSF
jgi:hypothetical protein